KIFHDNLETRSRTNVYVQKFGLANGEKKERRASDGELGYLKDPFVERSILVSTGEILDFESYMLAPALIIAPIGAISILTSKIFVKLKASVYVLYIYFKFASVSTLIRLVNTTRYCRSLVPDILKCSILSTRRISLCEVDDKVINLEIIRTNIACARKTASVFLGTELALILTIVGVYTTERYLTSQSVARV
ncbi:hypothetical protein MXB_2756, partial [Myxobolus squamalis]